MWSAHPVRPLPMEIIQMAQQSTAPGESVSIPFEIPNMRAETESGNSVEANRRVRRGVVMDRPTEWRQRFLDSLGQFEIAHGPLFPTDFFGPGFSSLTGFR